MPQVTTATYLTPLEGELLRAQLGFADIPSHLSNVEFVTWFWYLSNAVGGVRLQVATDDLTAARDTLWPEERDVATNASAERSCGGCGEQLPGDWHVCWRCGTTSQEVRDPDFFRDDPPTTPVWYYLQGLDAPVGLVLLAAILVAVFPPAVLIIGFWLTIGWVSPGMEYDEAAVIGTFDANAAADIPDALTDEGDDRCARALRSALLGVGWFLPLVAYSIWTLLVMDFTQTPVSPRGRRWYWAAWCVSVGYVLLFVLLFIAGTWLFLPAPPDELRKVLTGTK